MNGLPTTYDLWKTAEIDRHAARLEEAEPDTERCDACGHESPELLEQDGDRVCRLCFDEYEVLSPPESVIGSEEIMEAL